MSKLPLVSVIIPTHKRPKFLKRTIQSILDQSYKNLEIIVISNGFNEKNQEVVRKLKDPRLFYADQKNSGGPASPRNHGLRVAKGKYIAFCDDDDLWMPKKLEKQVKALEAYPDYGLCYTNMMRFNVNKKWISLGEQGEASLETLLYINTVPISSVVIRRSLVKSLGGFCESKMVGTSEDYEFLLRLANSTKFYYINEKLIKYWSGDNRDTILDEQRNFFINMRYFLGIIGCYYLQIIHKRIKISQLIKPFLYHFHGFIKSVGYYYFQKLKQAIKIKR